LVGDLGWKKLQRRPRGRERERERGRGTRWRKQGEKRIKIIIRWKEKREWTARPDNNMATFCFALCSSELNWRRKEGALTGGPSMW
jgi:hypothetical protein